jgi:hypothetical protein
MNPFYDRKTIWFWQRGQHQDWIVEGGLIRLKIKRMLDWPKELEQKVQEARARLRIV